MKLLWLTDIHLNFLDNEERLNFYQKLSKENPDAILISGDIAEAPSTAAILTEMVKKVDVPTYFVLGNHDFYRGSIDGVHQEMKVLTKKKNQLFWLPAIGVKMLTKDTALVGQDGWADGRNGDYQNSRVVLNDSRLIVELFQASIMGSNALLEKMQALGDQDAKQMEQELMAAIQNKPKQIIVLTHVPPFKEACFYRGQLTDDNFLPFYSSKAMGDMLLTIASKNPNISFLVLSGHTHGKAEYSPLKNLTVKVGHAEYYTPEIQEVILL